MKNVLIFPGAFNPPHLGHVSAVEVALTQLSCDELWIVPSGKREDKAIEISYEDRRSLGNLFLAYLKTRVSLPVQLITAELDDTDGKDTKEVLDEIKSQPDAQFTQLIGADGYLKLRESLKGKAAQEKFAILKRPGYELPNDIGSDQNVVVLNEETPDVSSTHIRALVKERDAKYKELVPREIASYMEEHALYSTMPESDRIEQIHR